MVRGGNTSDRPVQLLDRRRLAGRLVALRQILTGQTLASRTLPGQSEASQSHHQLRPPLESLLKVSPTSDSIFHLSFSEKARRQQCEDEQEHKHQIKIEI